MQKFEERLNEILQKSLSANLTDRNYNNLDVVKKFSNLKNRKLFVAVFIAILSSVISCKYFTDNKCILEMPSDGSKIFREPESCDICKTVTQVEKLSNLSSQQFYWNYAKPSKPIVVTDGAITWPALNEFDYNFFKKLYESVELDNSGSKRTCQFFPYKTEFKSLHDVFTMTAERAEKSWYIGWSNCNDEVGKILKNYYSKPYFLSNLSENIALSWIFMGTPGHGAHMHVDNVHYPSWQAQLSGRKKWRLAPPPECLYKCQEMEVIVEPGEINTNRWYHQTFVLPGDISITIGSEFD